LIKLGKIIRAFRLEREITLKDLAAKADISPSYLSQIENDQVNMNLSVLENISAALEKPLNLFFLQDSIDSVSFVAKKDRKKVVRTDKALSEKHAQHGWCLRIFRCFINHGKAGAVSIRCKIQLVHTAPCAHYKHQLVFAWLVNFVNLCSHKKVIDLVDQEA
jgi:transcriptional regulator with XRE-family HTH domain